MSTVLRRQGYFGMGIRLWKSPITPAEIRRGMHHRWKLRPKPKISLWYLKRFCVPHLSSNQQTGIEK